MWRGFGGCSRHAEGAVVLCRGRQQLLVLRRLLKSAIVAENIVFFCRVGVCAVLLVSLGVGCESAGMVWGVGHIGREKLLPPSAVGVGTVQKMAKLVLGEGGLRSGARRAGSGGTALHQGW